MEQVREVPANETEQHGCDDQRPTQPGVLLEPGAVELGFEGVVLFGVGGVVAEENVSPGSTWTGELSSPL